jgi:4'-phosphopantetheinyl transferase
VAEVCVAWAAPTASPRLVRLLDEVERWRLERFRSVGDRERFVAAHALLRIVLARQLGCSPGQVALDLTCAGCGGPHGAPRPADPSLARALHLSLTHAGRRVAVAVSTTGPVGVDVDVESAAAFPGFDDVALDQAERSAIARLAPADRPRARVTAWVRKEAVLKATGHGLTVPPDEVVVSMLGDPARLIAWRGGPQEPVHLQDVDVAAPDHRACVAVVAARSPEVDVRQGDDLLGAYRSAGRLG